MENGDILTLPILPISHSVLFPGAVIPVVVFEESALALVNEVCASPSLQLGVVFTLPDDEMNLKPPPGAVGTLAQIIQHKRSPKGDVTLMVQGLARLRILDFTREEPFLEARAALVLNPPSAEPEAQRARIQAVFDLYLEHCQGDVQGLRANVVKAGSLGAAVDMALACVRANPETRQRLLETLDPKERAEGLIQLLDSQLREIELGRRLRENPGRDVSRN